MKKWLSAILTLVLLLQALPLSALAASGHVLTEEELAAAYALTGFGDSGARSNAAVHKGMTPNDTWNAMQVSDWLDEQLDIYLFSVEDILSRASVKLARLRESDPAGYRQFTEGSSNAAAVAYLQEMYQSAEALSEELRLQQARIEQQAGVIAELGRKLSEQSDSLTPSDRVRLSAKIKVAEAELKAARSKVAENAEQWERNINLMQSTLDPAWRGQGDAEHPAGLVGDFVGKLSTYGGGAVENSAPVAMVNKSGSRMGRMSAGGSVLADANSATVHVMSENEVGLVFYTSDGNGGKRYLEGVRVMVRDNRNPTSEPASFTSDARGGVYMPSNMFTEDDEKSVHFKLDVEAEDKIRYLFFY